MDSPLSWLHSNELAIVQAHLRTLPCGNGRGEKSGELENAETFIDAVLNNPCGICEKDPCTTVGDLLIALESHPIPVFVTMNGKESQHLCKALGQHLIVRSPNPRKPDVDCPVGEPWPSY
jgi:hypothetical protein